MKLDKGFMMRTIIDETILVPIGNKVLDFRALINLTPVGVFICSELNEDRTYQAVLECIIKEYDVDEDIARQDLTEFLDQLADFKALEGWPA